MAPSNRLWRRCAAAALPALVLLPATAHAQAPAEACKAATAVSAPTVSKSKRTPSVSRVTPMRLAVGGRLELRGRYFRPGRCRNTVVFQRIGGRAVFVKADIGTRKLLRVTLPDRLEKQLTVRRGLSVPTRFRLRVLSVRFGKRFTTTSRSPVIGPKPPPAPPPPAKPIPVPDVDTDGDGQLNSVDADDDNDLLTDVEERAINAQLGRTEDNGGLSTLKGHRRNGGYVGDTDDDGVGDGYELRTARDLNSTQFLPYPGKRSYANPLDATDAETDFDGDGLTLASEQRLWRYEAARIGRALSLDELSYSDGTKFSAYSRDGSGRRVPGLPAAGYEREANFRAWAAATGNDFVDLPGDTGRRPLLDVNRDGVVSGGPVGDQPYAEASYYDLDGSGALDDGERDEDADGLTNIDETDGQTLGFRMTRTYWNTAYSKFETEFGPVEYAGTRFDDPDSDGDGMRDGADDQDFDDVPNIMELSRAMASNVRRDPSDITKERVPSGRPDHGRVQPFNPCLPNPRSRTCPNYVISGAEWAPFDESPHYVIFN